MFAFIWERQIGSEENAFVAVMCSAVMRFRD
jgi:hypothetical protein